MFPRSRPSPPLRCKLSSTSTFPDACGRVVSAAMFHLADQPYLNPYAVRCSYCHADRCRRDKTWNSSIPIAFAPCRALTAPRATWTPTLPIRFAAGQTDAPEPVQRLEEPLLGTYNTVTGLRKRDVQRVQTHNGRPFDQRRSCSTSTPRRSSRPDIEADLKLFATPTRWSPPTTSYTRRKECKDAKPAAGVNCLLRDQPGRHQNVSTKDSDGQTKIPRQASERKIHDTACFAQGVQSRATSLDHLSRKRLRFIATWSDISEGVETVYQIQLSTVRPTDNLFSSKWLKPLAWKLAKAYHNVRLMRFMFRSAPPRTVRFQPVSRLETVGAQDMKKVSSLPSSEQKQLSEKRHNVELTDGASMPTSSVTAAPLPEFPVPKFCIHEPEKIPPGTYFSHKLYRDPDGGRVKVDYITDYATAEKTARLFLHEPVLGFDLEWETQAPKSFKDHVSLLQLASPSRIALFHLAQFKGTTPSSVLPPTLIKLLESPTVLKCGVAVKNDALRLETYFELRPRGCFELSHVHYLISQARNLDGSVPRKLYALQSMCTQHLGLPLSKDPWVRSSRWAWRLSDAQKHYAAADAYAGLVLFHELERKRMEQNPVSPRPRCVDYEGPIMEVRKVEGEVEEEGDWADVDSEADNASELGSARSASKLAIKVEITRRRTRGDPVAELDPVGRI
jgi:hypothetical protein